MNKILIKNVIYKYIFIIKIISILKIKRIFTNFKKCFIYNKLKNHLDIVKILNLIYI
jgi:hypothetical protein